MAPPIPRSVIACGRHQYQTFQLQFCRPKTGPGSQLLPPEGDRPERPLHVQPDPDSVTFATGDAQKIAWYITNGTNVEVNLLNGSNEFPIPYFHRRPYDPERAILRRENLPQRTGKRNLYRQRDHIQRTTTGRQSTHPLTLNNFKDHCITHTICAVSRGRLFHLLQIGFPRFFFYFSAQLIHTVQLFAPNSHSCVQTAGSPSMVSF